VSPRRRVGRHAGSTRGQGLVEFALILPVFIVILLSLLDFGLAFSHNLTLEYSTREGARTGAALGKGKSPSLPCASVDNYVMAAVQRVLKAPGSTVNLDDIGEVHIYRADANGAEIADDVNVWRYNAGTRPTVDGQVLDFGLISTSWSACDRSSATPNPDSIGISITYQYHFITPIASALSLVGGHAAGPATLPMTDRTVMQLNPASQ
jgi:TadE-like protein